ncbi:UDP-glucoronosyl and UDP-glucosyl transferase [Ancylostoma ceylanicum]|uniref:glucuronosyltransferase n=1 Tax=Ancylostoma ceylanicum TaxID=53326 RepID=A0A0D6LV20_9BILA|nr:UDP-glucoronosyl and UDP-glucosyl transferase [Ancylostoma ceylanicum]
MLEQYDSCGFGIFRAVGIHNIVWLSATGTYAEQPQTIGVNYPLSYVPNLFAPLGDEMNFLERAQNVLISAVTSLVYSSTRAQQSKIFWRTGDLAFGEDLLSTARSSDSIVANTLPSLDFAMPTSNKMAYIGGFTVQKQPGVLDMNNFFTAFSRFPEITFIVKYETANSTVTIPPNVQLTQWIPQAKLMAHPNYLAIITHGGWSSILESINVGKPLVLMPLFADHGKNSKAVEAKGAAVILDKMNPKTADIMKAITSVTTNQRYRENCAKLSRMMQDPSPIDHAALLDYQVRRAAKLTRKSFQLSPKECIHSPISSYLEVFIGISIALVTIAS